MMFDMNIDKCRVCGDEFRRVSRHVTESHALTLEEYFVKFFHDGKHPVCQCGCGTNVSLNKSPGKGFLDFVHGHHAKGRKKSDEEKRKIGEKNSRNMIEFYEKNPRFIAPDSRRNEVISFVKGGLQDLSVSRTSFSWGVPVPGDTKHIMYVWLDALTNYITECGYPDTTNPLWRFWPADLHIVGKDIIRFHCVYWPAFLMSAGVATPKRVFASGWWTTEGQKISKSLGNAIDPVAVTAEFGLDPVRYFLLREVPFGNDGDFQRRALIGRLNADLANAYGNLCQRVLSIVAKSCGEQVPLKGALVGADTALLDRARGLLGVVRSEIDEQAFHKALISIWEVIADANRYVDAQAPWALAKTDPVRRDTVLWVLAEAIRRVTLLVQPFMPDSAARILDQLAVPAEGRAFASFDSELTSGTVLPKPQGVFPRFVEAKVAS